MRASLLVLKGMLLESLVHDSLDRRKPELSAVQRHVRGQKRGSKNSGSERAVEGGRERAAVCEWLAMDDVSHAPS